MRESYLNSSETEARIEAVKYLGILRRKPILVGTLLIQQWLATRDHAGVASLAEARRQRPNPRWPVLELATRRRSLRCRWQRPPAAEPAAVFGAVAAAARAALDACELQDDRGSKRDALARTPPAPPRPLPHPQSHGRRHAGRGRHAGRTAAFRILWRLHLQHVLRSRGGHGADAVQHAKGRQQWEGRGCR